MKDAFLTTMKYLLFPLVLIWFVVKIIFKKDVQSAIDSLGDANQSDVNLASNQAANNQASNEALNQANEISKEKEEIKNSDISINWHKER
jgi:hypothetical protein